MSFNATGASTGTQLFTQSLPSTTPTSQGNGTIPLPSYNSIQPGATITFELSGNTISVTMGTDGKLNGNDGSVLLKNDYERIISEGMAKYVNYRPAPTPPQLPTTPVPPPITPAGLDQPGPSSNRLPTSTPQGSSSPSAATTDNISTSSPSQLASTEVHTPSTQSPSTTAISQASTSHVTGQTTSQPGFSSNGLQTTTSQVSSLSTGTPSPHVNEDGSTIKMGTGTLSITEEKIALAKTSTPDKDNSHFYPSSPTNYPKSDIGLVTPEHHWTPSPGQGTSAAQLIAGSTPLGLPGNGGEASTLPLIISASLGGSTALALILIAIHLYGRNSGGGADLREVVVEHHPENNGDEGNAKNGVNAIELGDRLTALLQANTPPNTPEDPPVGEKAIAFRKILTAATGPTQGDQGGAAGPQGLPDPAAGIPWGKNDTSSENSINLWKKITQKIVRQNNDAKVAIQKVVEEAMGKIVDGIAQAIEQENDAGQGSIEGDQWAVVDSNLTTKQMTKLNNDSLPDHAAGIPGNKNDDSSKKSIDRWKKIVQKINQQNDLDQGAIQEIIEGIMLKIVNEVAQEIDQQNDAGQGSIEGDQWAVVDSNLTTKQMTKLNNDSLPDHAAGIPGNKNDNSSKNSIDRGEKINQQNDLNQGAIQKIINGIMLKIVNEVAQGINKQGSSPAQNQSGQKIKLRIKLTGLINSMEISENTPKKDDLRNFGDLKISQVPIREFSQDDIKNALKIFNINLKEVEYHPTGSDIDWNLVYNWAKTNTASNDKLRNLFENFDPQQISDYFSQQDKDLSDEQIGELFTINTSNPANLMKFLVISIAKHIGASHPTGIINNGLMGPDNHISTHPRATIIEFSIRKNQPREAPLQTQAEGRNDPEKIDR